MPYESVELTIGMDPNDSCYDAKVALLAKYGMEPKVGGEVLKTRFSVGFRPSFSMRSIFTPQETIPIRSDALPSGLLQYAAFVMSPAPEGELEELVRATTPRNCGIVTSSPLPPDTSGARLLS